MEAPARPPKLLRKDRDGTYVYAPISFGAAKGHDVLLFLQQGIATGLGSSLIAHMHVAEPLHAADLATNGLASASSVDLSGVLGS